MNTIRLNQGDDVRSKTRTDNYNGLGVTLSEINEHYELGLCTWSEGEIWIPLNDLILIKETEGGFFGV
jgi:hypothetical protein